MIVRFTNLITIDGDSRPLWISDPHWAMLKRRAGEVHRRTGARAWLDLRTCEVVFGYETCRVNRHGAMETRLNLLVPVKLFRMGYTPCAFDPLFDTMSVEDVVYCLHLARVDPALKERWRRGKERTALNDKAQFEGAFLEDSDRGFLDRFRFTRKRIGMGRHYRGSAVVQGGRS